MIISRRLARLAAGGLGAVTAVALAACGGSSGGARTASGARFSPYVDVTLPPAPALAGAAAASGSRALNLAFVTDAANAACTASWDGARPLAGGQLDAPIAQLRAHGIAPRASFGGRAGVELARSCPSIAALTAQYQAVIDRYQLDAIDFDIEGATLTDRAANARRAQAIAALQARNSKLRVSFTLPVLPTGLDPAALALLRDARAYGVRTELVNVLAMDYGSQPAPSPQGRMGRYAIAAATSTQRQLRALYPAESSAQLWSMIAVTPMLGQNDVAGEVFTESDARQLLAFARAKNLGQLSMWSLGRDRQCPASVAPAHASATCSGASQQPYAFARTFAQLAG